MQKPATATPAKSGGLWDTVKTVFYAVAIALLVRTFGFEPFNIPSGSMKPTLLVGDYLFVSKFAYGYSRYSFPWGLPPFSGRVFERLPERGDVVVFKLPSDNRTDYIKRVIGLPGDKVQVVQNVLFINGKPVQTEQVGVFGESIDGQAIPARQLRETLPNGVAHEILDLTPNGPLDNTEVFEVPAGHFFAMGDNRDNSQDSRTPQVRFVPVENLVGRAEIIQFSIDGGARWLRPWRWPLEIRYERLFQVIR